MAGKLGAKSWVKLDTDIQFDGSLLRVTGGYDNLRNDSYSYLNNFNFTKDTYNDLSDVFCYSVYRD